MGDILQRIAQRFEDEIIVLELISIRVNQLKSIIAKQLTSIRVNQFFS